jgi:hypothetical protein
MKVPFDDRGNLLTYPQSFYRGNERVYPVWLDNLEFETKMTVTSFTRGRSSAIFILKNGQGREHPMFLKDLYEMLLSTTIINGEIYGTWTFCKRGQNYGLQWVG